MGCLQETMAWEKLNDPKVGGRATAEEILELCKAAGYSEEESQKVASQRALDRMRLDLPP
jgi:hypothetical protein